MGDAKEYGQNAVWALLEFDRSRLGDRYEVRSDGIWVVSPTKSEVQFKSPEELKMRISHPDHNVDSPALPFPFTAEQFFAFCESDAMLAWDCIEADYSNNDDSLDEAALAMLAGISKPAEELVRGFLIRKYELVPFNRKTTTPSKLSSSQKQNIRDRLAKGEKVAPLAEEFNVSRRTIDKCKVQPEPTLATAWPSKKTR